MPARLPGVQDWAWWFKSSRKGYQCFAKSWNLRMIGILCIANIWSSISFPIASMLGGSNRPVHTQNKLPLASPNICLLSQIFWKWKTRVQVSALETGDRSFWNLREYKETNSSSLVCFRENQGLAQARGWTSKIWYFHRYYLADWRDTISLQRSW